MTVRPVLVAAIGLTVVSLQVTPYAQVAQGLQIRATSSADLRTWDSFTAAESRAGTLRRKSVVRDPALPGRTVERFEQYYDGVRIWGADVVRDSESGMARSIFGVVEPTVSLSTAPALSVEQGAAAAIAAFGGASSRLLKRAELVILPSGGGHRLAYQAVVGSDAGVARIFVDAHTGSELLRIDEIQRQAAVGTGVGVLGDQKKLSVLAQGGVYVADDQHRPPVLTTYDMRGSVTRAISVLNGAGVSIADLASDSDNDWSATPAQVDAHVHIGWTYDYFFKRFERRGLDNQDRPIAVLTNAVSQQGALSLPLGLLDLAINAFWCGSCGPGGQGMMYFGNGIPPGFFLVSTGNNYGYFAGALDIAAHELTHAVLDSSSGLIYQNESGALNEAFADIIGTSVEFFYHPAGSGPRTADYLLGEDISRAVRSGARDGDRSLQDPAAYGDPDHYSRRFIGAADQGGVHTNSGIANHAFYLAIEGGTNRTSGLSVRGVGAANREQIERVFYRAFVFLLPANATFSIARAATIQAARDLYGPTSGAERAVTEAWTAVGVN
jgi:thermolysin